MMKISLLSIDFPPFSSKNRYLTTLYNNIKEREIIIYESDVNCIDINRWEEALNNKEQRIQQGQFTHDGMLILFRLDCSSECGCWQLWEGNVQIGPTAMARDDYGILYGYTLLFVDCSLFYKGSCLDSKDNGLHWSLCSDLWLLSIRRCINFYSSRIC